ncbi:MAG: L-aspartate oxidase [Kiritimatiellae bacterium]|nr:L-aspartate oxidase [Kiritimatiellia bacterium]
MNTVECDYLIAGSGIAGLMSAIHLAPHGRVLLITKKASAESNSNYAQGGIACVMEQGDSFERHVADTLDAGAGLCNEAVVRRIVEGGPARIAELESLGVSFNPAEGGRQGYDLGREGGHTHRRVLHAGDITGQRVESVLLRHAQQHPNIRIMEHARLIDLVTTRRLGLPGANRCVGAYALDPVNGGIFTIRAPWTVLATGGCGKVYLYTSNPDIATGDGVAIGWRAGASVANMEFIQFHPTCLYHPQAKNFLISEAVRGEGAELVDREGRPFMKQYDPRGSLAPRDIVARAIDAELKRTAAPYCCLDIRHKSREFLKNRFPNIYDTCLKFGIDMATDLVPVVPAAHYCCGGIRATVEGVTSVEGLLAVGEVACTGLHGANRLASNSLLEALVCAHAMAERLGGRKPPAGAAVRIPDWESGHAVPSDELVVVTHNWSEVRTCMWDYVGIVRTAKRLERAGRRIRNLRQEIRQYYFDYLVTGDTLDLRNLADVAELIVRCARLRHESRGLHYTLDYAGKQPFARDTVLPGRR